MLDSCSVALKPLALEHAAKTLEWMNDPELCRLLCRAKPITEEEHARWFASLAGRDDCAYFAVVAGEESRHIGNVWLWDIDTRHRKAELRVMLGAGESRGRGWGSEAIRQLCAFGYERLALHKLYAYVLGFNPGARRAFEKAGFALEGVLKADRWSVDHYVDVFLLGRLAPDR